jgi:sulfur carrier protein ThiS
MISITFKLFALLSDYLPAGHRGNAVSLELEPGTTVMDLVERYRLPPRLVHLVLINGVYFPPEQHATRQLVDGEVLAIWPPVAGG